MNKNNFFRKYGDRFPSSDDAERRWKIYEKQKMMEEMMASVYGASTGSVSYPYSMTIEFTSIYDADQLVGDSSNIEDWNIFFDLPANGTEFSKVSIDSNSVTLFNTQSDVTIKESAFYDNDNIISVSDNGCVFAIEANAFSVCNNLISVSFNGCTTTDFAVPPAPASGAFANCPALTTVSMPSLISAGASCFRSSPITTFNLESLQTAGNSCFSGCTSLVSIDLPSFISGGASVFDTCTALVSASLPLLQSIGSNFFNGCTSLLSLSLPELIQTSTGAFTNCTSMQSISLPSLGFMSGNAVLGQCGSLTTIDLPGLTGTASGSQNQFTRLNITEINLPELIELNGTTSFRYSTTLRFLLPKATKIASGTFRDCGTTGTTGNPRVFDLRSCTDVGGSVGYNQVWLNISGTATQQDLGVSNLHIPASILTCNTGGTPDGDIGATGNTTNGTLRRTPNIVNITTYPG